MQGGRCPECGATLADGAACIDRFHAVLAAEAHNDALRGMHGLTVLTYHLQHPSLTRPWYQVAGREMMRRIFGQGEDWRSVLREEHPRGAGRKRAAAAIAARKAAGPDSMPDWVIAEPVAGEMTILAVDPEAPSAQIEAWARSVAIHRYLAENG